MGWFCFVYVCMSLWEPFCRKILSVTGEYHWMVLMIFLQLFCLLLILKTNTFAGWIDNSLHNNGFSEVLKKIFNKNFISKSFTRFILSFINLHYWEYKVKNVCMMIKICKRCSHSNTTVKPVIINNFQSIIFLCFKLNGFMTPGFQAISMFYQKMVLSKW